LTRRQNDNLAPKLGKVAHACFRHTTSRTVTCFLTKFQDWYLTPRSRQVHDRHNQILRYKMVVPTTLIVACCFATIRQEQWFFTSWIRKSNTDEEHDPRLVSYIPPPLPYLSRLVIWMSSTHPPATTGQVANYNHASPLKLCAHQQFSYPTYTTSTRVLWIRSYSSRNDTTHMHENVNRF
jgi:hypothetical protein